MEGVFNRKYSWILHALLYVSFAIVVRSGTFLQSSYDWDENLYVLGAKSILDGYLPYIKIWDHKPPGIFFLFAPALVFFESPIIAIRLLSCFAVGMTAYFLCRIICFAKNDGFVSGVMCGFFYVLFTLNNGGFAANSEIFYLFFISLALFLVARDHFVSESRKGFIVIFSGICLGVAGSINYLAMLYGAVVAFYMIFHDLPSFPSWKVGGGVMVRRASSALLLCIGPVLVFALIIFVYAVNGALGDFYFANVTANKIYVNVSSQPFELMGYAKAFGGQFAGHWLLWICVFLLPVVWRAGDDFTDHERTIIYLSLVWIVLGIIGVSISRLFWAHYFLQFAPALCMISAIIVNKIVSPIFNKSYLLGFVCLLIISIGGTYSFVKEYAKYSFGIVVKRYVLGDKYYGDVVKQISVYIDENISRNEYIYVVDYHPIIYYLTGAEIPTKYVFPPFLIGNISKRMIGVDSLGELYNILKLKPKYIVKKHERPDPGGTDNDFYSLLSSHISKFYDLDRSFSGIDIYLLKK